jgi:hypothetical protein
MAYVNKLSFLVLLSVYAHTCMAQLKGIFVRNQDNEPIANCIIFNDTIAVATSDSNGYFSLEAKAYKFIVIKKENHVTAHVNIWRVKSGSSVTLFKNEVKEKKPLTQHVVGFTLKEAYSKNITTQSRLKFGGFHATRLSFELKPFYIDELNFYVADYLLPDTNKELGIKICECFIKDNRVVYDTSGRYHFIDPMLITLDKKNSLYTVKLDTAHTRLFYTSCLFVEFEMMYKPTPAAPQIITLVIIMLQLL